MLDRTTWKVVALFALLGCSKPAGEEVATSTDQLGEANADGLVISQVYGGAGAPGVPWNRDYVELFNRGAAPITLARGAILFGGVAGDIAVASLKEGAVIPPGGYYLVGFGSGVDGADVKVDDAGSSFDVHPTAGVVKLFLGDRNVDLLTYGSGTRTKAILRKGAGCAADVEAGPATPRNAKTPPRPCGKS